MNEPNERAAPGRPPDGPPLRHKDGVAFAGTHLIIDLYGARSSSLTDAEHIEATLATCARAAGATLLSSHFHAFTPHHGITGVAVLAESHISIHTWPEYQYAAIDVFMCGDTEPERTIRILENAFQPEHIEVIEHLRGRSERLR